MRSSARESARFARAARLDTARWTSIERVAPAVQRWRYRETLGCVRRIETNYDALQRARTSAAH